VESLRALIGRDFPGVADSLPLNLLRTHLIPESLAREWSHVARQATPVRPARPAASPCCRPRRAEPERPLRPARLRLHRPQGPRSLQGRAAPGQDAQPGRLHPHPDVSFLGRGSLPHRELLPGLAGALSRDRISVQPVHRPGRGTPPSGTWTASSAPPSPTTSGRSTSRTNSPRRRPAALRCSPSMRH
jgi:hypothetical protein